MLSVFQASESHPVHTHLFILVTIQKSFRVVSKNYGECARLQEHYFGLKTFF